MSGKTEKQRMLAGELYLASDAELVADRLRARDMVREYNGTSAAEIARRLGIVTSDIPARVVAAGNPCRVIRALD